jgi:predicted restriction endonuclease
MDNAKIYAHILNAQELGFRKGEPHKAGRYLYVAKNAAEYFPPLSNRILNDQVIIDVVPPDTNSVALTTFKYHNSKWAENKDNGRDEYRMYFNLDNDRNREFYEPGDIILIKPFQSADETIYKLFRFTPKLNGDKYRKLQTLIFQADKSHHSHALFNESDLNFINLEISDDIDFSKRVAPEEVKRLVFNEPVFKKRETQTIERPIRDQNFRDFVLLFYNYQCALTGEGMVISYGNLSNLEAAHIIPVAHRGGNNPSNGIPLTRDLHWAFDKGFFTVNNEYEVVVHEKAMGSHYMKNINKRKLILPEDTRALPNSASLQWHNENVFGLFIRNGI